MNTEQGQYWRVYQVANFLGISESTVWKWTKSGRLPKSIRLSYRVTVWESKAIKKLMADEIEASTSN